MKKFILGLVVSLITTLSVQAQNVVAKYDTPKFFDNTYVTVNGGVITPTKGEASFEKYRNKVLAFSENIVATTTYDDAILSANEFGKNLKSLTINHLWFLIELRNGKD